ncbi:lipoprotein [Streptomyces fumigatiscleroticus]|nr:lipoprotein [Streptomyces fumigatiscleroticus]
MANTSRSRRRAALLTSAVAALGLLTACGDDTGDGTAGVPQQPAAASRTGTGPGGLPSGSAPQATPAPRNTASQETAASASASRAAPSAARERTGGRCHTSELRASVGRLDPGAGQRNFPVVLTNVSDRTCTLHGYPGAAFVDASGAQLGPDPVRSPGTATTVEVAPGRSAWAGLSYADPQISGARGATPAALLVTPPDERSSLKVRWTDGAVPVGGNASSVRLTVLSEGTGP